LRHLWLGWNKFNLMGKPRYLKEFFAIAAQREQRDDACAQHTAVKD
jgi:hypothetical protein